MAWEILAEYRFKDQSDWVLRSIQYGYINAKGTNLDGMIQRTVWGDDTGDGIYDVILNEGGIQGYFSNGNYGIYTNLKKDFDFNNFRYKFYVKGREEQTTFILNNKPSFSPYDGTYALSERFRFTPIPATYGSEGILVIAREAKNTAPTASTIPNQSTVLNTNKTVALSNYFSDPDGDTLSYTALSSNTNIATISISASTLTITPKSLGSTTITVTANDGKGGTISTTFTFSVVNTAPTVSLTAPLANQTLYENDVFNLAGTASDTDNGNSVTIRYQINASTARAIKAFVSNGTAEAFSKTLTFKGGNLYDGDTLIASNLADGVPHTLKVWATDDQGGTSVIAQRTFYVVPNRAPRLEVTPPTIEGNIDSDTFTVSGTYADDDKNEVIISYRINGNVSKEVARGADGTFDFTLSLAQLKNGNNTISVEAIDSYGAKTSRTIKMSKNTIATPLLQSTVRYLIQPPKGSAQAVLLWLQRDQDLAVTASLHMGMKGEAEAFTLLEPTNTAPLRDNAAILEDEFYHEADSAKDHIILQLDMKRSSIDSTAAIHLISGVFE